MRRLTAVLTLHDVTGSVAQISLRSSFPFPWTDLSCGLSDGYAKGSEAVQDGYSYLELRHLTVEVPRHEALAQEFDGSRIFVSTRLRR